MNREKHRRVRFLFSVSTFFLLFLTAQELSCRAQDTGTASKRGGSPPASHARSYRALTAGEAASLKAEAEKTAAATARGKKEKKPGKVAVVPHVRKGPVVDGVIDEMYAAQAACLRLERNSGPADIARKYDTRVYLLTDPRYLYVAFTCREPTLDPASYMKEELSKKNFRKMFMKLSKLKERDQAMWDDYTWEDMYCEFILEPGGARKPDDYYHIAVNTLGTLYDAARRDEINWDPDTVVKTRLGKKGHYVIEMAIPLASLVPPDKPFPVIWCANFLRLRHHVGELAWSESWKTHMPKNFGTLLFALGKIDAGK